MSYFCSCFQLAEIDSKVGDLFRNQIETPLTIVKVFHYSLFGLAPVMAAVPAFILYWQRRRGHKKVSNTKKLCQSSSDGLHEIIFLLPIIIVLVIIIIFFFLLLLLLLLFLFCSQSRIWGVSVLVRLQCLPNVQVVIFQLWVMLTGRRVLWNITSEWTSKVERYWKQRTREGRKTKEEMDGKEKL